MKACPSFPGYSVSEDGLTVISTRRRRLPLELLQRTNAKGYRLVAVKAGERMRPVGVHQLVADAFLSRPVNADQVRHLDGDASNNRASNLAWAPRKMKNGVEDLKKARWYLDKLIALGGA